VRNGSRRSPWFYATLGCGLSVLVALVATGLLIYFGAGVAGGVRRQLAEPATRAAEAQRMLGTARLPSGYEAELALAVPLLGEIVLLREAEDATGAAFVYGKLREGDGGEPLDPSRNAGLSRLLELAGYEITESEPLGAGEMDAAAQRIAYAVHRARLTGDSSAQGRLVLPLAVSCLGDRSSRRLGLWLGRRDEADEERAVAALRALFETVNVCAR
jgi:hypothetical protein